MMRGQQASNDNHALQLDVSSPMMMLI